MKTTSLKKQRAVILVAGDFPKKSSKARVLLENAPFVICCDSAADSYRRIIKREPDLVIGDCDSVRGKYKNLISIAEQETNDLEKAVRWCEENGVKNPVVLGAMGKRDDHTLGNVFRALSLGLEIVSDYGRFVPVEGEATFKIKKGDPVSIFATNPETRMTSTGLEWPLENVIFKNLYCATLNRANATNVKITATKRVYVYFAARKGVFK